MTDPSSPGDLSDEELYEEYQAAKQHGPVTRIDDLQYEIARRWEGEHEQDRAGGGDA